MRLLVAVTLMTSLVACGGISADQHRKALDNQKTALMAQSDQRAAALQAEIDALKTETAGLQTQLAEAKAAAGNSAQALQAKISSYQVAIEAATRALTDGLALSKKKDPKAEAKFNEAANTLANVK
jgi:predicted  nucleic acid-binding Zn-ribbon protein